MGCFSSSCSFMMLYIIIMHLEINAHRKFLPEMERFSMMQQIFLSNRWLRGEDISHATGACRMKGGLNLNIRTAVHVCIEWCVAQNILHISLQKWQQDGLDDSINYYLKKIAEKILATHNKWISHSIVLYVWGAFVFACKQRKNEVHKKKKKKIK